MIKEVKNANLKKELELIGFDKSYRDKAVEKYEYKNLKLFNLSVPQANIVKQTAISVGADCAVHREVITSRVEKTDAIMGGSVSQLRKIAEKLRKQPFSLSKIADEIEFFLNKPENAKTKIVGILNLTTNSFSDGGEFFEFESAVAHLNSMIEDGADIIDIGAESTKPYSEPISAKAQLAQIEPILKYIKENDIKISISIDTRLAEVAQKSIELGANVINDVSGFDFDEKMVDAVAKNDVKVIIQHSKGTPENMQNSPEYASLMDEIYLELAKKIDFAISRGVKKENIIVDPGIGFGKTREHNFEIIRRIDELRGLGCPIMLGISRKSLLNMPDATNATKDIFTVAVNALAIESKVDYIRVHNVGLHSQLLKIIQ